MQPERTLGPWALLSPLAHGGMGSVYLAMRLDQAPPRSLVLVKTLKAGLADASDYESRFTDEMRVAVRLRHPNLCAVFEGGCEDGEFFLTMELIEGVTFKRLLALVNARGLRLTSTQATALAVGMLRGLHGAHAARDEQGRSLGVVHRDVSPHNAMVDVHGCVKVIDFGLATSVLKETFTESAVVLGKSAYMAPEQARGEDATVAADQYAAGVVLCELLTQERFYGDLSSRQIWSVAGAGNYQPRLWPQVSAHLQPAIARALSSDPKRRFPSCQAFADALLVAEPAADDAVLRSVGQLVRQLEPDELAVVARARALLAALEGETGRSLAVSRPERRASGGPAADATLPLDDTAATQLVPRSSDGSAADLSSARVTDDAAATRRLVWLVAAFAGVACVIAVGVAVFVLTRPPPVAPTPVVVVQPAPPASPGAAQPRPAPGPVDAEQAARQTEAEVAERALATRLDERRERLRNAAATRAACPSCKAAVAKAKNLDALGLHDIERFLRVLEDCGRLCESR